MPGPRTTTATTATAVGLIFAGISVLGCHPDATKTVTATATTTTPEDRAEVYERYRELGSLIRGGSIEPRWRTDGSVMWYVDDAPDHRGVFEVRPGISGPTSVVDLARLRAAIGKALERQVGEAELTMRNIRLTGVLGSAVEVTVGDALVSVRLDTYEPATKTSSDDAGRIVRTRFDESPVVEVPSPDGTWYIGVRDHNLWLRRASGGEGEPLTTDGVEDYEWVEKHLRTRTSWARWSPDSTRLAVKKADSRGVPRVPVVEWFQEQPEVVWVRYGMTGGRMFRTDLYVFDIPSGRRVRIDTGDERDIYLQALGWSPDGSQLLFLRANRLRKRLDLMAADPTTGASRTLVKETSDTFVVGFDHDLARLYTPVGRDKFAWLSERDGWRHIYLYDSSGRLIRRLTSGQYPVMRVVAVSADEKWIYFYAHSDPDRPYDNHLHRVPVEGGDATRLTEATGHHEVVFSPTCEYYVDTHSTVARPPTVELRRADGRLLHVLSRADISAIREVGWTAPEEFVATATDGKSRLYGVLIKPFDFDPNRRYPVVEHIYAGPQVTVVPRTFYGHWSLDEYLYARAIAQLGFIVLVVDGRGTPGRGKEFQDVVYGNFGRYEIPEHAAVLRQLASERPYMDLDRVGIMGGSWGGYFALRALLVAPEIYRVAIADCPDVDFYHDWPFGYEAYMGLPKDNLEAYEYASNLSRADALKGKLLLVVGTRDPMVFTSVMQMVESLVKAQKPYDLIVLPKQGHDYAGDGATYFAESVRRYLVDNLRPYESSEPLR